MAVHDPDRRLAGFIGLCGWLPLGPDVDSVQELRRRLGLNFDDPPPSDTVLWETPILLAHCRDDATIPVQWGREMATVLSRLGVGAVATDRRLNSHKGLEGAPGGTKGQDGVVWLEYASGGHWINEPQGVDDIIEFLHTRVFGPDIGATG